MSLLFSVSGVVVQVAQRQRVNKNSAECIFMRDSGRRVPRRPGQKRQMPKKAPSEEGVILYDCLKPSQPAESHHGDSPD